MIDTPLTDARAHELQADGLIDAEFTRRFERENAMLLSLLERHHANATVYSRSLQRAMSTCAEFKTDSLAALIESAYMESLGNETAEAIKRNKLLDAAQKKG